MCRIQQRKKRNGCDVQEIRGEVKGKQQNTKKKTRLGNISSLLCFKKGAPFLIFLKYYARPSFTLYLHVA